MSGNDNEPAPDIDVPEGYEIGTIDDAIASENTYRKIITDDDSGKAFWFDLKEQVPQRKKDSILEDNLTMEDAGDGRVEQNLSVGYYYDMLEYMIVDWFGEYEEHPEVSSLRVFFNKMSTVFSDLQDEVPQPFDNVDEVERGK